MTHQKRLAPRTVAFASAFFAVVSAAALSGCTNKEGQVDTSQGNPTTGPVTTDTSTSSTKTSPVAEGDKMGTSPSAEPAAGKGATAVTNAPPKETEGGPGGTMMNKPSKNPMGALGDAEITLRVKNALIADTNVKAKAINVDTKSQIVVLRGTQETQAQIDAAIADAQQIKGVDKVDSQLTIGTKK